ncbi:MAG TPA: NAD(P)-dependent oxidoreductase [Thermoanaerobaculia bacterium]|nr:NAD(P)-dependent oxidoreductase [Thermoanaerobaculia bacterium]
MRIFIAAEIEPRLIGLLRADSSFALTDDLATADIVITRTITRVDAAFLDRAPSLRFIAQGTSGIDNIDLDAAAARGIEVINLPGVNANAVAELVIGHIIALTRTVPQYVRELTHGQWRRSDCATRHELRHYRLGIVGLGNVGTRVARLARAFGMPVRACDPYVADADTSLDELLATSDIITLHVPLTDETREMIGAREVAQMPKGSILINAARGEVLDLDAALAALNDNHLGGLAVDVFENEPMTRTFPDDPRLIVTPHIAGCTFEAKNDAAELLYDKLRALSSSRA